MKSIEKCHVCSTPAVLAVIGVGLIGGSFAAALRQSAKIKRIVGVESVAANATEACKRGLIDECVSLEEAVIQADIIFLSVPLSALESTLIGIQAYLSEHALITDSCSTKVEVVQIARRVLGNRSLQFIPGHPIAGSEKNGPQAAWANLYKDCTTILTPLVENRLSDVDHIRQLWQACGATVTKMSAVEHDDRLAAVSHIPHFLAAIYMAHIAKTDNSHEKLALAGSGFRDFTRIAAGSPEIWRDIFLFNRQPIQKELTAIKKQLEEVEQALAEQDVTALLSWLEQASEARRDWALTKTKPSK